MKINISVDIKSYLLSRNSQIYSFALMILFWTIFDSTMAYITPILIEERNFSKSMIGLIIGSSSITGAILDFIICKFVKNTNFKILFLLLFIVCLLYPVLLWRANTVWLFLLAMGMWGLYYDIYGFGVFNFIGRHTNKSTHSKSFGIVQTMRSIGEIIAPLILGIFVINQFNLNTILLSWIFLLIGFIFYLIVLISVRKNTENIESEVEVPRRKNIFIELHLWKKIGTMLFPVLFLTFYLYFIDAFFWTLAPLYGENEAFGQLGGLLIVAYVFPSLIVSFILGKITNLFGKKRTAITGLFIGSAILSIFTLFPNIYASLFIVFLASLFLNMALPSINAAYADYISESVQVEGEIESLEDFSFNIGYVVGPISAGILAEIMGINGAFSLLGVIGTIVAIILFFVTPKSISIVTNQAEL